MLAELAAARAARPDAGRLRRRARRAARSSADAAKLRQGPGRDRGQRHLARGHRLRRRADNEVTILTARGRRVGACPARRQGRVAESMLRGRSSAVRRRASGGSLSDTRVKSRDGQRIRPVPPRLRLLDHGDHQAAIVPLTQGPRPRARQGLDPRGARPRAVPRTALRGRRRRVRGGRRQRAHRTTTRSSAWAARCSCSAATARPASRSRWPVRCAPSGRDYRLYRDRARATPGGCDGALGRGRCYPRSTAFVPVGEQARRASSTESGRTPAFFM